MSIAGVASVAKKQSGQSSKKPGTMIRVSEECAAAIGEVTRLENLSIAEWMDAEVLPLAARRYREGLLKRAKKLGGLKLEGGV